MSAPFDTNRYRATILRHVDADTTWVMAHLPFDVRLNLTVRWLGVDAPERFTDAGKAATAAVEEWLPVGAVCEIETVRDRKEKFGRYLAVFFVDGVSLNQRLIDEGYARPYDGGAR